MNPFQNIMFFHASIETVKQNILKVASQYFECSLRALDIVQLEGYVNLNFKIQFNGNDYFVKLENPYSRILKLSMLNEVNCRMLLNDLKLTVPILFYDAKEAVMITEFIPSIDWEFSDAAIKERYLNALRCLHKSNVRFPLNFCPFQVIEAYIDDIKKLKILLFEEKLSQLMPKLSGLKQKLPTIKEVPCHLDPQFANVIVTEDMCYFIDLESAAMGDPFFDLASLSASEVFSDNEMYEILYVYLKRVPDHKEVERMFYLRILADMRMSLICFLQTKIRHQEAEIYRTFALSFLQRCSERLLSI